MRDEFTLLTSDEFDLWVNVGLLADEHEHDEEWWSR